VPALIRRAIIRPVTAIIVVTLRLHDAREMVEARVQTVAFARRQASVRDEVMLLACDIAQLVPQTAILGRAQLSGAPAALDAIRETILALIDAWIRPSGVRHRGRGHNQQRSDTQTYQSFHVFLR
jgi:hypothetical protein